MTTVPTLSGAQFGVVQPWREVEGGVWFIDRQSGALSNKPCALRVLRRQQAAACGDYARQYLENHGDKKYLSGQLGDWALFFRMLYALIEVPKDAEGRAVPLITVPSTLADASGKLSPQIVPLLPTKEHDFADGQLQRLGREYELLVATQTPDAGINSQQWEAIVDEGKELPLKTLLSRHGSSRLIQVLHGLNGAPWPE